jgi:hypothetical protein
MFAVALWASFVIGLGCAWSRRWYVVLAGGLVSLDRELRRRDRLPRWNRGGVPPARTAEEEKGGVGRGHGWLRAPVFTTCTPDRRPMSLRLEGGLKET